MEVMKWAVGGLFVIVIYVGSLLWAGGVWAQEQSSLGQIAYSLPYPGLLPDSPIYFVKVARDQVMLWLARDQQQKAFYLLLLSDKRLAAGEMLINKGNGAVGATSVLKGEEYFKRAVDQAVVAKQAGKDTRDLFAKLLVAAAKHTEVISSLLAKVSGKDAEQLTKAYQENQTATERVKEIFFPLVGVGT